MMISSFISNTLKPFITVLNLLIVTQYSNNASIIMLRYCEAKMFAPKKEIWNTEKLRKHANQVSTETANRSLNKKGQLHFDSYLQ